MKFPGPVHAPEGLNSYAKVNRVRPVQTAINIVEALLSLLGVVVLILVIRYHSFEKAGLVIDQALGCVHMHLMNLMHSK
jgi:hypothetical protein